MSYNLIYSVDGHELASGGLDSLAVVNAEIRRLYDRVDDPVTILRIEQDEPEPGPRTWAVPPAPDAKQLTGKRSGGTWTGFTRDDGRTFWKNEDGWILSWSELLDHEQELVEVVETELEAAVRRLREGGWADGNTKTIVVGSESKALHTVLAHVLNGGTLP